MQLREIIRRHRAQGQFHARADRDVALAQVAEQAFDQARAPGRRPGHGGDGEDLQFRPQEGEVECQDSGSCGFTVRVIPLNADAILPYELPWIVWAE